MNAQEAIEKMEAELSDTEMLMGDYSDESVVTYLEALSIILESAKLLHDELIDQTLIKNEDSFRVLCLQTDLEEYKEITYDQARAIGLEEGVGDAEE